jgi:hypothetical protein
MANTPLLNLNKLRAGYYETEYGNVAIYKGGKSAHDLDADERIPTAVLYKWLKPLERTK